jgi:hypothetical protein
LIDNFDNEYDFIDNDVCIIDNYDFILISMFYLQGPLFYFQTKYKASRGRVIGIDIRKYVCAYILFIVY